jgi:hypothetical protein
MLGKKPEFNSIKSNKNAKQSLEAANLGQQPEISVLFRLQRQRSPLNRRDTTGLPSGHFMAIIGILLQQREPWPREIFQKSF